MYTTVASAFCLCHECSLIFRESITGDRFCPDWVLAYDCLRIVRRQEAGHTERNVWTRASVGKYFETSISRETRVVSYAMGLRSAASIAVSLSVSFLPFHSTRALGSLRRRSKTLDETQTLVPSLLPRFYISIPSSVKA